jgi:hypothetical protein
MGIRKTRATPLHPQSDGMVERMNQTLGSYPTKMVSDNQQDWDYHLHFFLMAYRSSLNETTKETPARIIFGRDLCLPCDLQFGCKPGEDVEEEDYITKLRKSMDETNQRVRSNLEETSGKMKERYDIKADQGGYQAGDLVWLYNPKRIRGYSPKLQNQWEGPYEVVTRINDVVYRIKKLPRGKPRIVHFNRLAPFHGSNGVEKGQAAQMQCTLAYEGFRDAMILSPPRSIMCIMIHFATRMNFSMMERLNWIMTARKQRKKRVKRRMWARRAAGRKHRPILPPMSQRLMLPW